MGSRDTFGLRMLLHTYVVELAFTKRTTGGPRVMLCTNAPTLLASPEGRIALHWHPPKGVGLPYNPSQKKLVVVWDIMWQQYRQVPIESVRILDTIPVRTDHELDDWWEFFADDLQNLTGTNKKKYMGG